MHRVLTCISNIGRPSDRVQKKMENYAEIFGNTLYYVEESVDYTEKMPDYAEISKINKVVPLAFPMYKTHSHILPRIFVLCDMFHILLPFVDSYFFVQRSFSIVFVVEFVRSLETRH